MTIHEKILAFQGTMAGEHHRYRSWEHCYGYFHRTTPSDIAADRQQAALQLGFYLASWGMYRGSSFLLQHAYTAHLGVIDQIIAPRFSALLGREFGGSDSDTELVPIILEAVDAVREAYKAFRSTGRVSAGVRHARDQSYSRHVRMSAGLRPLFHRWMEERGVQILLPEQQIR